MVVDPLDLYVLAWPNEGLAPQNVSCLAALARDARGATRRDLNTGIPESDGPTPSWLGTLGYLILLEQIGEAVHTINGLAAQTGIPRSLAQFSSGIDPQSVGALAALRNAFAHDYGLVAQSKDQDRRHIFRLDTTGPLVELPAVGWDRNWTAHPEQDATRINVYAVAELAESVITAVGNAWWDGVLDTDLAGGRVELAARFLFTMGGQVE